jgi:hypothetical protein
MTNSTLFEGQPTMPELHTGPDENWEELDALVEAELELVLTRRIKPVGEPEAEEVRFLDETTAFLTRHPDPRRLIAEITRRFPAPVTLDLPESGETEEARDEPA